MYGTQIINGTGLVRFGPGPEFIPGIILIPGRFREILSLRRSTSTIITDACDTSSFHGRYYRPADGVCLVAFIAKDVYVRYWFIVCHRKESICGKCITRFDYPHSSRYFICLLATGYDMTAVSLFAAERAAKRDRLSLAPFRVHLLAH